GPELGSACDQNARDPRRDAESAARGTPGAALAAARPGQSIEPLTCRLTAARTDLPVASIRFLHRHPPRTPEGGRASHHPGLSSFSLLGPETVQRNLSPLYGWKVARRDRAAASGRQAGHQRSSDRGIERVP